jgi:hypothetical protein
MPGEAKASALLVYQSRGSKVRERDDSLAAVKDCVLDLPLFAAGLFINRKKERRYPPNKKNVSLAGLFSMLE